VTSNDDGGPCRGRAGAVLAFLMCCAVGWSVAAADKVSVELVQVLGTPGHAQGGPKVDRKLRDVKQDLLNTFASEREQPRRYSKFEFVRRTATQAARGEKVKFTLKDDLRCELDIEPAAPGAPAKEIDLKATVLDDKGRCLGSASQVKGTPCLFVVVSDPAIKGGDLILAIYANPAD